MNYKLKLTIFACCSILLLPAVRANAEEGNKSIPGSASEVQGEMDQEFSTEIEPETKLSELLKSSEITLKLRNYYLNRDKPGDATDPEAWAQGATLAHKMGRVGGVFSMNTELMGSFPLYAPDDHGGTLLLDKYNNEITTIGVLNPRLTALGSTLSLFRQKYNLPFVNEQDNRVLPNTFEGYTIGQTISTSKKFQYVAGYIDNMKKRDSQNFVSMSDAAGVNQLERGLYLGGARVYFTPDWSLGGINYFVDDIMNIFYAESNFKTKFTEDIEQTFSAQYASETSVGDDLLLGRSFSTGFFGLQSASSYKGFVLKAALTADDSSADIRSPYGSYPGYNSVIVEDFNRANEVAWQVGLSYDLAKVGLDGFKAAAAYIQGNNAENENTGANLADKNETDVTLDYRVADGMLNGLWVRLRSATIKDDDAGTTQDFRVIINYDFALLAPEKPAA